MRINIGMICIKNAFYVYTFLSKHFSRIRFTLNDGGLTDFGGQNDPFIQK